MAMHPHIILSVSLNIHGSGTYDISVNLQAAGNIQHTFRIGKDQIAVDDGLLIARTNGQAFIVAVNLSFSGSILSKYNLIISPPLLIYL